MVNEKPPLLDESELQKAAPEPIDGDDVWLPLALLAPPVVWSLNFVLSYGLVYPAQRWQTKASIYLVLLTAALLCLASIGLGWRLLHSQRREAASDRGRQERAHFLAICACALGGFFLLATLAQTVPVLILSLEAR